MFTIGEYVILKFLASTLVIIWARLACKRLGKDRWTAQAAAGQPSTLAEQTPFAEPYYSYGSGYEYG